MPRWWYDYHANRLPDNPAAEDVAKHDLNRRILADRKPYFMRYIYPQVNRDYMTYVKNTAIKSLRQFGLTIEELQHISEDELTEEQADFLRFYGMKMPVGTGGCVMNRICRRFEEEFDGIKALRLGEVEFDPSVLKSGMEYSAALYYKIDKLRDEYMRDLQDLTAKGSRERVKSREMAEAREELKSEFLRKASLVCTNERQLGEIMIDLCYKKEASKAFAWSIGAGQILENLLEKHERLFSYPEADPNGEIEYREQRFSMREKRSDPIVRGHFERESMGGTGDEESGSGTVERGIDLSDC